VSLDEPLRPIEVDSGYTDALLVVSAEGAVLGEIALPAQAVLSVELQEAAIAEQLGERLWRRRLVSGFLRAARGTTNARGDADADVSVVICTRERPDELGRCLESITALRTRPREVVVVDNSPGDPRTREVCERFPVAYVVEEVPGLARARNRGILESSGRFVAFTDDDCVVDPHWLDGVADAFDDPLVMVVAGYVGPLELETPAQYLFHQHGGFERRFEPTVLAGPETKFCGLGDGNAVFRRAVLEEVGLFAEDLGPGTPAQSGQDSDLYARIFAAGYRIAFDPSRIVWHRNRPDYAELKRAMSSYACGVLAVATRRLLRHRDPGALGVGAWWCRHVLGDVARIVRGADERVPADLVLAEATGMLAGPWRLFRSARRGRPEPLRVSASSSAAGDRGVAVVEPEDPPLSVVIASYNRRESLAGVLEALVRQAYPTDRFEVVVVLDGSSDGSADRVRGLDLPYALRLLEQDNRGLAATRNRGALEAANPVVLFLDDDIMPVPSYLAEHAAAHRRAPDPHVALGYCPPVVRGGDYWSLTIRAWWEDFFRRKAEPGHQWTFFDFSDGTASLARDLFLEFGGFDEELKDCQDHELGLRLLERGVPFAFYPAARAWHHLDTSLTAALRGARTEGRADVAFATKHPHAKGRLRFAYFPEPGGGVSGRHALAYRHAERAEQLTPLGLRALDVLEALKLPRAWGRLIASLSTLAYIRGMKDALPSPAEFQAFVASIPRDDVGDTLTVKLDAPAPLRLPKRQAPVELSVALDGVPIARTPATEPELQWNWDALSARVVDAARRPLGQEGLLLSPMLGETDREPGD
jgi:GT2 family glycosyltransferase